jgi:hypothetical protein
LRLNKADFHERRDGHTNHELRYHVCSL